MNRRSLSTRKGIAFDVLEAGSGAPLLFLHGAGGLLPQEPLLDKLAARYHVYAPEWPGFGKEQNESMIEDMLDFTLHGWDVADALGLDRFALAGHSMGGMIAAEMAAINPKGLDKLVLLAPSGLWLDECPIPDIFGTTPFQLPGLLFASPESGERFLTGGVNFADRDALRDFMVGNARRLGTAGKILFPIPNRRLSKRLYRLTTPTLLVWGREDKLIPPVYLDAWKGFLPDAETALIDNAGHMLQYEQPDAVEQAVVKFLG